jgi:hypothetical protein
MVVMACCIATTVMTHEALNTAQEAAARVLLEQRWTGAPRAGRSLVHQLSPLCDPIQAEWVARIAHCEE